jgi:hypothetical protein
MKIINEKGKLFGIINIIDLAVIVIILLLVGAVGYKFLGSKIKTQNVATKDVTFVVKLSLKPPYYLDALKEGDKLVSGTYETNAYIEKITSKPGEMTITTAGGEIIYAKHPTLYDFYVKIRMKASVNTTVLKLGVQEIRVGGKYEFQTRKVDMDSTVDSIHF